MKTFKKSITFDPEKTYFIDVETGLAQGFAPGKVWLIGIGNGKEIKQFLYPEHQREFFKYVSDNNIKTLVSWTRYDQKALSPIFESNQIKIRFFDACQRTSNAVIWDKYQLHELYRDLFSKIHSSQEVIPGRIAGLYADHLIFKKRNMSFLLK